MSSPSFQFRESSAITQETTAAFKTDPEPTDWGVCLGSAAVLVGVLGLRWGTDWGDKVGEISEEIFRGDRLPLLPPIAVTPTPMSQANVSG